MTVTDSCYLALDALALLTKSTDEGSPTSVRGLHIGRRASGLDVTSSPAR